MRTGLHSIPAQHYPIACIANIQPAAYIVTAAWWLTVKAARSRST